MKLLNNLGRYYLYQDETMGYAIFVKSIGFLQQVTRWYSYKGDALRRLNELASD